LSTARWPVATNNEILEAGEVGEEQIGAFTGKGPRLHLPLPEKRG